MIIRGLGATRTLTAATTSCEGRCLFADQLDVGVGGGTASNMAVSPDATEAGSKGGFERCESAGWLSSASGSEGAVPAEGGADMPRATLKRRKRSASRAAEAAAAAAAAAATAWRAFRSDSCWAWGPRVGRWKRRTCWRHAKGVYESPQARALGEG